MFKSVVISNFPIALLRKMQEKKLKEGVSFASQIREAVRFWFESMSVK